MQAKIIEPFKTTTMPKPAARIRLATTETIKDDVESPSITFRRKGDKSVMTIKVAFNQIADAVDDTDLPGDGNVFHDAVYAKPNFLRTGNAKVYFLPLGLNGASTMYLTADIDTKLPRTGSGFDLIQPTLTIPKEAAKKAAKKAAKSTKKRYPR